MKRLVLLFLFFFGGIYSLAAQQLTTGAAIKLQQFTTLHPQEKVHVHFDRDSYTIGDTVWFKAYVVNAWGNRLSSLSEVVYLDITSPKGEVKQLRLPLNMGMAIGQVSLTDSLFNAGSYEVNAYTRGMYIPEKDYFFTARLMLSERKGETSPPTADNKKKTGLSSAISNAKNNQISLQFFPEGGALVSGIRSKVALKALDVNGMGIPLKGYIENNLGEKCAVFETAYQGMGTVAFMPKAGESYSAVIQEGAAENRFPLPAALSNGYVLSINHFGSDTVNIRVSHTGVQTTALTLIAQSGGEIQQVYQLPMKGASVGLKVPKELLAEGINQFTLFDESNIPVCERLVFIQKEQTRTNIQTEKGVYGLRDKVKMDMRISDLLDSGIVGGYSVAIVKTNNFMLSEEKQNSIYANLLLQSDLKGSIETPNYYFTDNSPKKEAELDMLLLTQGWTRFKWNEVLLNKPKANYLVADRGLRITGKVAYMNGKPVAGAKVALLVSKQMVLLDTISAKDGSFAFNELDLEGEADVIIRASGPKGEKNLKITLDEPFNKPTTLVNSSKAESRTAPVVSEVLPTPPQKQEKDSSESLKIRQGTTLQAVEIIHKRRPPEIKNSAYPFAAAPPDLTLDAGQLQEIESLQSYLKNRLPGIMRVEGDRVLGTYKGITGPSIILLNGMVIEDFSGINPKTLTGLQVVQPGAIAGNMATALMLEDTPNQYKQSAGFGIIFLTMDAIPAKYIKAKRAEGFVQFNFSGYTYPRDFYVPDYEKQKDLLIYDNRPTLFWKPDIITGEDGKASFDFYTSDEPGRYKITLEGVGANGQITRKISYFEVK